MIPQECGWVVLFWAKPRGAEGYGEAVARARESAERVPGYLGQKVVEEADGSLSIIFWKDKAAMEVWKNHPVHLESKSQASKWYFQYQIVHCEVQK